MSSISGTNARRLGGFGLAGLFAFLLSAPAGATVTTRLRVIQDGTLWDVNPDTGSYNRLSSVGAWTGATSMAWAEPPDGACSDPYAYIIQDSALYHVCLASGSYTHVAGRSWGGPTAMTKGWDSGGVYIVQGSYLWNGAPPCCAISGPDWPGTTAIANDAFTNLFLIGGNHLWRLTTNAPEGYTDLGGGWNGSLTPMTIHSGSLSQDDTRVYIVQNSRLWRVTRTGVATPLGGAVWAGATSIAIRDQASSLYIIQDSRLFTVDLSNDSGTYHQLGSAVWTGATLMVVTETVS